MGIPSSQKRHKGILRPVEAAWELTIGDTTIVVGPDAVPLEKETAGQYNPKAFFQKAQELARQGVFQEEANLE